MGVQLMHRGRQLGPIGPLQNFLENFRRHFFVSLAFTCNIKKSMKRALDRHKQQHVTNIGNTMKN
jgi:hypothetical protein